MKRNVLILYSQADETWKEQAEKHISVLKKAGYHFDVRPWNNERIRAEEDWFVEFESALDDAGIIILMVSKRFLDSKLMESKKVRDRLKDKQEGGFPLVIVLVNQCAWKRYSWMKSLPLLPSNGRLLSDLGSTEIDSTLTELTTQIAKKLKFETQVTEGILSLLQLNGIGPAKKTDFEPNRRLNIVTGDNGFGKTFLLECAWWALSGMWAKNPVYPRDDADRNEAVIRFQLMAKSGSTGKIQTVSYDWEKQTWPRTGEDAGSSGLVVYARVDGSFAVWDPEKAKIPPPAGASRKLSPFVFEKAEVINGIEEKIPGKEDRSLCNGLLEDWRVWQMTSDSPFGVFKEILKELSSCSQETLIPGDIVRIPGDAGYYPSIRYPYGNVPIIYTASSVQRIASLAYLILWTWEEHKKACKEARKMTYKHMVVLIDEVESHLHPQWQRSIIPSLLKVKDFLEDELDIQFLLTTHSPLVMASIEPVFNRETDKLFHQYSDGNEIVLKEQPFLRHGRVDNWYTSKTFDLKHARSREAEKAIEEAVNLQDNENPTKQDVEDVHERLVRYLSESDTFWPRWTYFAEQHGIDI